MTAPTRAVHTVSDPARPALSPLLLLVAGVVLIAFTFMRYSVPAIAWVTDQYERVLGSLRADGSSDGVMVASVPGKRVPTFYARTGEIVPLVALAFCVLAPALAIVAPRRRSARDA
jgi:hypothetical protein